MSKLSTRVGAAATLVAGASVMASGTSFAMATPPAQPHRPPAHSVPDADHEGRPHAADKQDGHGTPPTGPGRTTDGESPTGNENPGPLPPRPDKGTPVEQAAKELPFCPPVKDINASLEGMYTHLNFPLVGGVQENVPDFVNDFKGFCFNADYPTPLSPGNEIPAELFTHTSK